MEWLTKLAGQTVALDTAPLIYLIEANPKYLPLVEPHSRDSKCWCWIDSFHLLSRRTTR